METSKENNRGSRGKLIAYEEASSFDKYIIGCDIEFKKDIAHMVVMKNGQVISTIETYDKDFHKQLEEYLSKWNKTVVISQQNETRLNKMRKSSFIELLRAKKIFYNKK